MARKELVPSYDVPPPYTYGTCELARSRATIDSFPANSDSLRQLWDAEKLFVRIWRNGRIWICRQLPNMLLSTTKGAEGSKTTI